MITIIAFIINSLAPIVNIMGLIGLCGCGMYGFGHLFIYSAILFVVGLVFGVFAYNQDIPPRWFWSKSKNDLFRFAFTSVLGYAWSFAMWPTAIWLAWVLVTGAQDLPEVH